MPGPVAPDVAHHRGAVAALSRSRRPDDPELIAHRDALRAAMLEVHVERLLATAPPLTPAQRDRLAVLLQNAGGASA